MNQARPRIGISARAFTALATCVLAGEANIIDEGESRFALARYKNDGRPPGW
jgi:hypothetical protein